MQENMRNSLENLAPSVARLRTYDLLRGCAILGVIFLHVSLKFPTHIKNVDYIFALGRYGVQLFFLISAMTMCHMWLQRKSEINKTRNFYIRRLARIAPLFWISIPVYLLIYGTKPFYWAPHGISILQIALNACFLHGFWPDSFNSVVPGGWSIAVEVTFYAIFPFLIEKAKTNQNTYIYLAIIAWIINTYILKDLQSNLYSTYYSTNSKTIIKDFIYFSFTNQCAIFFLGCHVYFCTQENEARLNWGALTLWLSLGAVTKFMRPNEDIGLLTGYIALAVSIYYVIKFQITSKFLEALGKNSYSIYLSHFAIIEALLQIGLDKNKSGAFLYGIIGVVALSYLTARITARLIEDPAHAIATRWTSA